MVHNLRVFITSADGFTGHHLIRVLASDRYAKSFAKIYAGTQDPKSVEDLNRLHNVEVVKYNPDDKDDLARRFKGVHLVYMIPPCRRRQGRGGHEDEERDVARDDRDDRDEAGAIREATETTRRLQNMIEAAKKADVRCAGLWSPAAADSGENHRILKLFREVERTFEKSGIENRCLVRVQMYMQSFLLYARQVQTQGELPLSIGKSKFAPLSLRDHSRFIAHLLTRASGKEDVEECPGMDAAVSVWTLPEAYRNRRFALTGPEALTGDEIAKRATQSIGQGNTIRYKSINREEAERILRRSGWLDQDEVRYMGEVYDVINKGRQDSVSNDYKEVVGHKPSTIEDFFLDHQSDFSPRK